MPRCASSSSLHCQVSRHVDHACHSHPLRLLTHCQCSAQRCHARQLTASMSMQWADLLPDRKPRSGLTRHLRTYVQPFGYFTRRANGLPPGVHQRMTLAQKAHAVLMRVFEQLMENVYEVRGSRCTVLPASACTSKMPSAFLCLLSPRRVTGPWCWYGAPTRRPGRRSIACSMVGSV
jgi:hypothetical protein